MLTAAEMRTYIREHFTRSAYRWEQLPVYEVASDGNDYGRYLAGEPAPDHALTQPWRDRLASEKALGLYRHRARLLHEPLHPYEKYECEWGYLPNSAAGETIRVLRAGEHPLPADLVDHDFWLLDEAHPLRMHYGDQGEFLGATIEPDLLDRYRAARDAVWELAEPFGDWWDRHPELHRDTSRRVS